LRTTGSGKPECIDGPAISISHSGDLVACAISPAGCVGIDVQFPVPQRRTEAIARQYFTLDESAWLRGQHSDRFYMLWVLKEAYLKAVGVGLAGGLDALECRIDPPEIEATAADAVSVALYSVGPAFLAIATTGYRFSEVRVQRWHPDDPTAATASGIRLIARSA
jgi:phosphopantetheinyl transferase